MPYVLTARRPVRRLLFTVVVIALRWVLGVYVIALRLARVVINVLEGPGARAEQRIAASTGRPALSQTGIKALAMAFATEFLNAYRQTTR